ncbi:MAG TPA: hypothetical protein VF516_20730 [Kofleriaceae bacterium]
MLSTLAAIAGCGVVESPMADDAGPACDPLAAFDPPQPLLMTDAPGSSADPALSADELTLYLTRSSPAGDHDLFVATRSRVTDPFGAPVPLAAVDSTSSDAVPTLAAAGLDLVFESDRIAGEGKHLYVATRSSALSEFGAPALVAGVRSPDATDDDQEPFLTADGKELWFISNRTGNNEIFRATWSAGGVASAAVVPALSSSSAEQHVILSADRRTVYFSSNRSAPGARGGFDIYRAHRNSVSDGFGPPAVVSELNTASDDSARWLSADSCRLYMHAKGSSGFTLLVATRHPAM